MSALPWPGFFLDAGRIHVPLDRQGCLLHLEFDCGGPGCRRSGELYCTVGGSSVACNSATCDLLQPTWRGHRQESRPVMGYDDYKLLIVRPGV